MILVKLVHEEGFPPYVFEHKVLIKLLISKDIEVKDVVRGKVLKDCLSFDPEHVVLAVEGHVVLLRLIILSSSLVEVSRCERTCEQEVVYLLNIVPR